MATLQFKDLCAWRGALDTAPQRFTWRGHHGLVKTHRYWATEISTRQPYQFHGWEVIRLDRHETEADEVTTPCFGSGPYPVRKP